jgi:hypothetical protein
VIDNLGRKSLEDQVAAALFLPGWSHCLIGPAIHHDHKTVKKPLKDFETVCIRGSWPSEINILKNFQTRTGSHGISYYSVWQKIPPVALAQSPK